MGNEDCWDNTPWMNEMMPGADWNATQNYTQTYSYDAAGNMLQLRHIAPTASYTRDFIINTTNNQLVQTEIGSDIYPHTYDALGNMTTMSHLNALDYNWQNSLAHIQRGTDDAYYQYRGGQRSRKLTNKQGGITEERIYLGNFEIYRNFVGSSLQLERKTVHISDDTGRIAMYEYRTIGWDNSPQELMRYIYSNNLSSAMLELDDNGNIISYEEYHPFGTTAYQATNSAINAVAKRYRYTGKERDEESGLYYHGARYYIPWLCRWTQCDPIGIKDGLNVYAYVSNNPVMLHDPSGNGGTSGGTEERPQAATKKEETTKELEYKFVDAKEGQNYLAPSGEIVLVEGAKDFVLVKNNDQWVIAGFTDANGSFFNWNNENRWFVNEKGKEFDNPWHLDVSNWGIKSIGGLVGLVEKSSKGENPFEGVSFSGLLNAVKENLTQWRDDVKAGGYRRQQALIGTWQLTSDLAKGSLVSSGGQLPKGFSNLAQFKQVGQELAEALKKSGIDFETIGVRGSSVTNTSSKGTAFRTAATETLPASDIDAFIKLTEQSALKANSAGMIHPDRVLKTFPELAKWSEKWSKTLGREITPALWNPQKLADKAIVKF